MLSMSVLERNAELKVPQTVFNFVTKVPYPFRSNISPHKTRHQTMCAATAAKTAMLVRHSRRCPHQN